jgi:hypothetical protein
MAVIDPKLYEFCTIRQLEKLEAIEKHGSARKAATAMGIHRNAIDCAVASVKNKAALAGYSPAHNLTRPVAPGQMLRGASTLYRRGEPEPVLQWVKSKTDDSQREQIIRDIIASLMDDAPRAEPVLFDGPTESSLCNVYTLTDSHVGALCWHREGGQDWDLKIAEATLVGCFERMIHASPLAAMCVVAQLGDFLHQDSVLPVTPTGKHVLDADGRFSKVVQIAVRVLRTVVDLALARHRKVVVLMAEGNHDPASSIWLRALFGALYEREPRVEVIDSPLPYYVHQHGSTMIGWHHGHLRKPSELPLLFAAQFPTVWGATTKRYVHCGHRHHVEEKEHSGVHVIQHPTLAARDAYAARGGWIADRTVTAVTYHDRFGRYSTATVCPEMLGDEVSSAL